jgi:hypothetical protein
MFRIRSPLKRRQVGRAVPCAPESWASRRPWDLTSPSGYVETRWRPYHLCFGRVTAENDEHHCCVTFPVGRNTNDRLLRPCAWLLFQIWREPAMILRGFPDVPEIQQAHAEPRRFSDDASGRPCRQIRHLEVFPARAEAPPGHDGPGCIHPHGSS